MRNEETITKVRELLEDNPEGLSERDVADALDIGYTQALNALRHLYLDGEAERVQPEMLNERTRFQLV